jgi:hypothetical protein
MPITSIETILIAQRITPILQDILNEYDYEKYPASDYARFKASFSALNSSNSEIEDAMIWKWGHWGKPNYPQRHRDLIVEIQGLWPAFIASDSIGESDQTFLWWRNSLNRQTTYITVAYITHLVHHNEPLPIIDQHNFRAMNSLTGFVRQGDKQKKRPSNWSDIASLKSFMTSLTAAIPGLGFGDLDRFLMMYGRNHAVR